MRGPFCPERKLVQGPELSLFASRTSTLVHENFFMPIMEKKVRQILEAGLWGYWENLDKGSDE